MADPIVLSTGRHNRRRLPIPAHGWERRDVLNGRLLPCDLSRLREDELLLSGKAALYPLGRFRNDFDRGRTPLLFVHGINGDPKGLQPLVDHFRGKGFQMYALCYDDSGRRTSLNGFDMAGELRKLPRFMNGTEIGIIAHSMGGIVTRQALNDLECARDRGIQRYTRVHFIAIDTPWHGYGGPSDGFLMALARPFMSDGYEDMRAQSGMFLGDEDAPRLTARQGLLRVALPRQVRVDLVFAKRGDVVEDYTEGDMAELVEKLVPFLEGRENLEGSQQFINFYDALTSARGWKDFRNELGPAIRARRLTARAVGKGLARHFPRFAGDHVSVLRDAALHTCLERYLAQP